MMLVSVLLFSLILFCEGVGEDYFLENEEQSLKDHNENISISNISQDVSNSKTLYHLPKNVTLYSMKSYFRNLYNKSNYNMDENMTDIETEAGKRIYNTEYENMNDTLQNKKSNILLDVLDKDFYNYNEPTTAVNKALRSQDAELNANSEHIDSASVGNTTNADDVENPNEKLLIDFYNLQPAESKLREEQLLNSFRVQNYMNNNIWYVPENLACWDLPILYGELGKIRKSKDVFQTLSGKLKNVIERNEEERFSNEKLDIHVSQVINKWCAADPCYGDHTLCLFPDLINSRLCVNDYEVSTPTMVEHIGLVNTINSMRNRVASGVADLYKHLPTAADMKQMIYDFDLEIMAEAWLHQCLPGPSACSSLDGSYVAQLECTKNTEHCCLKSYETVTALKCIPQQECFIDPIIGCIHTWFRSGVNELTATDVECGHVTPGTYNTVQLLWAETNKVGCAYGKSPWGDVRVVCNFAPGALYSIHTKSFCGFISEKEVAEARTENITNPSVLATLGIYLVPVTHLNYTAMDISGHDNDYSLRFTDVDILSTIYQGGWIRKQLGAYDNGTIGLIVRLVTKYTFGDGSGPRCDSNRHIYEPGEPGSMCVEKGQRFHALCYDFRDPTPGYRLVAVLAPVALFSLILYDLFSGVVRQTNC